MNQWAARPKRLKKMILSNARRVMKNKITFFFLLFSIIISANIFIVLPVNAADDVWTPPDIEIKFPTNVFQHEVKCNDNKDGTKTCSVPWMADYVIAIYKYAVGAIGILAVVVMMLGGIIWITAGGSPSRVGEAKAWITASLTGLLLVMCSYTILYLINPGLVNLKPIEIKTIKTIKTSMTCEWYANTSMAAAAEGDHCAPKTNGTWREGGPLDCPDDGLTESARLYQNKYCCCSISDTSGGKIAGCDILKYSQEIGIRNTKETDANGVVTCFFDCSSYVKAFLAQQGLGSVGDNTTEMLNNPRAVNYSPGMRLDENDVIVYPASGLVKAHTVICANSNCTQVYNMSGSDSGFKVSNSSYFLKQSGVKIIKI
jgi:hypothetical protein